MTSEEIRVEQKQRIFTYRKRKVDIYTLVAAPLSLILAGVCFGNCKTAELQFFWLLPFCYALGLLLLSFRNANINGLAYNIIKFLMFLRYVLATTMTVTSEKHTYTGIIKQVDSYTPVLQVMLYEMIVVFLVMYVYVKRHPKIEYELISLDQEKNDGIAKAFFVLSIIAAVVAAIRYPAARNTLFNFSFAFAQDKATVNTEALSGFMFVFFKIGVNVIYALLMQVIVRHSRKGNGAFILCCLLSVVFISCNWTGGGSVTRWGLVTSVLISYVVLIKLFPWHQKKLLVIGGLSFVVIIMASSVIKLFLHHGASNDEALSEIFSASYFNEYFQGIYPVSNGIKAMQEYSSDINFTTFLDDTISAYPWLNKLFYESGNLTEVFYHSFLKRTDKIIPTIAQGYAYFDYIGAPIFSGLLTYLALKCDTVMKQTKNLVKTVAITQIAVWCALFMAVNVFIIQRTTMYFVPMLIVLFFDKHLKLRRG